MKSIRPYMGYFSRIEFDERVLCEHRGANIPCVVWRSRESQILHSKENGGGTHEKSVEKITLKLWPSDRVAFSTSIILGQPLVGGCSFSWISHTNSLCASTLKNYRTSVIETDMRRLKRREVINAIVYAAEWCMKQYWVEKNFQCSYNTSKELRNCSEHGIIESHIEHIS